ncbi:MULTISPECIES: phosphopantetheine-binding protein [Clostridium]|uniref:phosphopantetheine-binding protein n=1 Tax=Clostridium TaxID=1485 RepID=UPI000824D239|nr:MULTISPECIES: phosphopantetheine-binding protein [Clostridium]PJI06508.1 hypothetical protein CUB90_00890 [Clostridium sp. CT7]
MKKLTNSQIEKSVFDILREKAEIDKSIEISIDSKLIDLGIDSFVAIQVLVGLEQIFDFQFPDNMLTPEIFATAQSLIEAIEISMNNN